MKHPALRLPLCSNLINFRVEHKTRKSSCYVPEVQEERENKYIEDEHIRMDKRSGKGNHLK